MAMNIVFNMLDVTTATQVSQKNAGLRQRNSAAGCSVEVGSMTRPRSGHKERPWRPYRPSRMYGFVRARQLDGTMEKGSRHGSYCLTAARVMMGWGRAQILGPVGFGKRVRCGEQARLHITRLP